MNIYTPKPHTVDNAQLPPTFTKKLWDGTKNITKSAIKNTAKKLRNTGRSISYTWEFKKEMVVFLFLTVSGMGAGFVAGNHWDPIHTSPEHFRIYCSEHSIKLPKGEIRKIYGKDGKVWRLEVANEPYYVLVDQSDESTMKNFKVALDNVGLEFKDKGIAGAGAVLDDTSKIEVVSFLEPKRFTDSHGSRSTSRVKGRVSTFKGNEKNRAFFDWLAPSSGFSVVEIAYDGSWLVGDINLQVVATNDAEKIATMRFVADVHNTGFETSDKFLAGQEAKQAVEKSNKLSVVSGYEKDDSDFEPDSFFSRGDMWLWTALGTLCGAALGALAISFFFL